MFPLRSSTQHKQRLNKYCVWMTRESSQPTSSIFPIYQPIKVPIQQLRRRDRIVETRTNEVIPIAREHRRGGEPAVEKGQREHGGGVHGGYEEITALKPLCMQLKAAAKLWGPNGDVDDWLCGCGVICDRCGSSAGCCLSGRRCIASVSRFSC